MKSSMDNPSTSRWERWRGRLSKIGNAIRRMLPFAATVLVTLAALLLYRALFPGPQPLTMPEVSTSVAQEMASATPAPAFSEGVYQAILPSLVLIQTKGVDSNSQEQDGLGSGIIIDANGDILTCLHVVAGASMIHLTFADGTQSDAQVTVSQPQNDIAVLQPSQLPAQVVPAVLGNPNAMHVGDEAYVVGHPFGLYDSMSSGVISAFNRSFTPPNSDITLKGLIQIDTAVNPGNSGGPVLNRYGQVIGIVEGIVNPVGQDFFVGIGFAVPINTAGSAAGLPPD